MSHIAIIILAAGASTRMGQPKQLLPFQGQPLLRHVVNITIATTCQPIVVVLGANAANIAPELANSPIQIIHNPDWETGMGSSIRCGIEYLATLPDAVDAAIVSVCDQPFISTALLDRLIQTYNMSKKALIASEYAGVWGVPALFDRALFPELIALQGAAGARSVIQQHRASGQSIPFPEGQIDLDTPDDYQRYRSQSSRSII
jgi:molybdenum cofactor cytidylyltransferase